jgi:hypothetical protein
MANLLMWNELATARVPGIPDVAGRELGELPSRTRHVSIEATTERVDQRDSGVRKHETTYRGLLQMLYRGASG